MVFPSVENLFKLFSFYLFISHCQFFVHPFFLHIFRLRSSERKFISYRVSKWEFSSLYLRLRFWFFHLKSFLLLLDDRWHDDLAVFLSYLIHSCLLRIHFFLTLTIYFFRLVLITAAKLSSEWIKSVQHIQVSRSPTRRSTIRVGKVEFLEELLTKIVVASIQ